MALLPCPADTIRPSPPLPSHGNTRTSTSHLFLHPDDALLPTEPPLPGLVSVSIIHPHGYPDRTAWLQRGILPRSSRNPDEFLLPILCRSGLVDKALDMLSRMDVPASSQVYVSLLRFCVSASHARIIRDHIYRHRVSLAGFLGDYLVVTLANCNAVDDAWQTACQLSVRTVFSWTALVSAHFEAGRDQEALKLYRYMREEGVAPDSFTFVTILKACGRMGDLTRGVEIHKEARQRGLVSDTFVSNALISMYGKCGAIIDAENTFIVMLDRDIVSWTALLSAYVEQGERRKAIQLYRQMQEEGVRPNRLTCVIALQACVLLAEEEESLRGEGKSIKPISLDLGCALHAYAHQQNMMTDGFICTTLVNMYGKCGAIQEAETVFSFLSQRNVATWNAMISAYVEQNCGEKALLLYSQMQKEGTHPDSLSIMFALQACAVLAEKEESVMINNKLMKPLSLGIGYALHLDACSNDIISDPFVRTTLVSMYGKCGAIEEAEDMFSTLSQWDIVSWTAMVCVYAEQGHCGKALELYTEMKEKQMVLDDVTLMLTWTAILSGLMEQGQTDKAVEIYLEMHKQDVPLDNVAVNCVLQACGISGNLEICHQVHFDIVCSGYDRVSSTELSLIQAYASCGSMIDAEEMFDMVLEPNVILWTALIAGHAGEGNAVACLQRFDMMVWVGVIPDEVTFSAVLSACCHGGLVDKGLECFKSMTKDYSVRPGLKHYSIIMDLFGRAGSFSLIEFMIGSLSVKADLAFWLCLLGACRMHGNVMLGRKAFDHAVSLQHNQASAYIQMSNIYAEAGLQNCAVKGELAMQKAGALLEVLDSE